MTQIIIVKKRKSDNGVIIYEKEELNSDNYIAIDVEGKRVWEK